MITVDTTLLERLPSKYACHYQVVPVEWQEGALVVAMSDPFQLAVLDELELLLECRVKAKKYPSEEIQEALRRYYGVGAEALQSIEIETKRTAEKEPEVSVEEPAIVRFVNQVLLQAYRERATDIHLEPHTETFSVRFRIDGMLHDIPVPGQIKQWQSAICSRLKIMARLDIAEKRMPQDGRIQFEVEGQPLDLRISVLPTPHGESIVLRLLRRDMLLDLGELGMSERELKIVERILKKPHGIFFVTGPTGSGKTTTLYACLNRLRIPERKIITVEDPIEYQLEGIVQTQVLPKIDLTFARGLRSMLRHDPDVMMVGEVRDLETAQITIRSALTGHLVLSTLHTNDAAGAITRLIDMQIEPFLIASALECVMAQRLVRIICSHCREPFHPDPELLESLGIRKEELPGASLYAGAGCAKCHQSGYLGRTAIYETLVIDNEIRRLVVQKRESSQIRSAALERGMRTMRQHGFEKVRDGITTIAEVLRVTPAEEEL